MAITPSQPFLPELKTSNGSLPSKTSISGSGGGGGGNTPSTSVNPATTTTLGIVEVSVNPINPALPIAVETTDPRVQAATVSQLGIVSPDGTTITITAGGVLSAAIANIVAFVNNQNLDAFIGTAGAVLSQAPNPSSSLLLYDSDVTGSSVLLLPDVAFMLDGGLITFTGYVPTTLLDKQLRAFFIVTAATTQVTNENLDAFVASASFNLAQAPGPQDSLQLTIYDTNWNGTTLTLGASYKISGTLVTFTGYTPGAPDVIHMRANYWTSPSVPFAGNENHDAAIGTAGFSLAQTPLPAGGLLIAAFSANGTGTILGPGGYTLVGNAVTFITVLDPTDIIYLRAWYWYGPV